MSSQTTGNDEVEGKVIRAICELSNLEPSAVSLDSKLEELGIDSLNGFHLLCELEEDLGITIPDDDARDLSVVRDVIERIRPLIGSESA